MTRRSRHACGENPDRLYSQTRMDAAWNFRNAYDQARKIKQEQDLFCSKAEAGLWNQLDLSAGVPDDLQWESLVDVLRGKVKVRVHSLMRFRLISDFVLKLSIHCYEVQMYVFKRATAILTLCIGCRPRRYRPCELQY